VSVEKLLVARQHSNFVKVIRGKNPAVSQHASANVAEECFPELPQRKFPDLAGAEIVEKLRSIGPGQTNAAESGDSDDGRRER
jgi:hypothetical protein